MPTFLGTSPRCLHRTHDPWTIVDPIPDRTVEDYVCELLGAGFTLSKLRECAPRRERFDDEQEFERRTRVPLVLLLAGVRAG